MAQVAVTPHLARHVPCPPRTIAGATVLAVLEGYFAEQPLVLDRAGGRGTSPLLTTRLVVATGKGLFHLGRRPAARADRPPVLRRPPRLQVAARPARRRAYDIVYRHALDIDTTGTLLAFGSTTGSLWLTENQGDAWQRLDANLPPIHGVRFIA